MKDPEIPVLDVVEIGIVRDVKFKLDGLEVLISPTYSGCPAMEAIASDIERTLRDEGYEAVSVKTVIYPPWTTDWMTEDAKRKLKEYGIAPPGRICGRQHDLLSQADEGKSCPYCNSENVEIRSEFGSTACKALYYCKNCNQPFEYFKCI